MRTFCPSPNQGTHGGTNTFRLRYRANEVTTLQNKKTVMPADVFRALDDIEFGFMRERVEAEFASAQEPPFNTPPPFPP